MRQWRKFKRALGRFALMHSVIVRAYAQDLKESGVRLSALNLKFFSAFFEIRFYGGTAQPIPIVRLFQKGDSVTESPCLLSQKKSTVLAARLLRQMPKYLGTIKNLGDPLQAEKHRVALDVSNRLQQGL